MPKEYGKLDMNASNITQNPGKEPPIIEPHWPGPGRPGEDDGGKDKTKPGTGKIDPGKGICRPRQG